MNKAAKRKRDEKRRKVAERGRAEHLRTAVLGPPVPWCGGLIVVDDEAWPRVMASIQQCAVKR